MHSSLRLAFAVLSLGFLALTPRASPTDEQTEVPSADVVNGKERSEPTYTEVANTGTEFADELTSNTGRPTVQQEEGPQVPTPAPSHYEEVDSHSPESTVAEVGTTVTNPEDELTPNNDTVQLPEQPTIPEVSAPCFCNLTPEFCDIGCCCDNVDCDVADLSTVFTGCHREPKSQVCIEKWLVFGANVEPSLITVSESLFCIQTPVHFKAPTAPLQLPPLGDSYHFSPPHPISVSHSRHFYRVDDVIQTYFATTSVRGLLRQPSPGATSAICLNRNPARFLRSESLSCTRVVTPESCTKDPNLNALSYYSDMNLIQIPKPAQEQISDLLIPVTPLSEWPTPSELNNMCINVAKKVEFVIVYTDRGILANVTVNVILANVSKTEMMQQVHSIQFKLGNPQTTPLPTIPSTGLRVDSSVLGDFSGKVKPVTVMGMSQDGECSSDPSTRVDVRFMQNSLTSCRFSSDSSDCNELRSQIGSILQGAAIPDLIAMSSGSRPDWTRVLKQECRVDSEETCASGCNLPHLLSVQVLWAHMGLLDLPQSYILGVKYQFRCKMFQCPVSLPVTLTTEVAFADMTVYPKPILQFGSP
ncbi:tectonic-3-like isoform X2 [Corythoichthys intestinalis]|uniref:tectonic-3-like isoform X2 n=1 Tax=Corythoichthys intestinalis TaxID=161448 RepID=UPI0025A5C46F|nr:tectonic-3-like isoform X2 [Corythoichthys intestinalis]